jgi:16S rRNA (cytosine967-C5)-methyltransferase
MSFDEETRDSPAAREAQVGLPARRAAIELLSAVIDKRQPLDDILSRSLATGWMFDLPQRDRALARAIVATSLRRRGEIDRVLDTFLERGMPDKGGKLYPILLSGAAQLIFLKTPPHAAIDLAVRLAQRDSRARRYDKLVNAVLRRVAKEGEAIASSLDAPRVNTPDWLWARWVARYGEERAHAIAAANLVEPPLDLTVKSDPQHWAIEMSGRVLPNGSVRLLPKGRIEALPGFEQGAWWVQDAAASLPAHLMGDVAGKLVADLCAAPGGKTAQLALAGASLVAVDISKTRLKMLVPPCSSRAGRSSIPPARSNLRKARPRLPPFSPETRTLRLTRSCQANCLGRKIGYSPRGSSRLFPTSSTSGRRNGAAWTGSLPRA